MMDPGSPHVWRPGAPAVWRAGLRPAGMTAWIWLDSLKISVQFPAGHRLVISRLLELGRVRVMFDDFLSKDILEHRLAFEFLRRLEERFRDLRQAGCLVGVPVEIRRK